MDYTLKLIQCVNETRKANLAEN